MFINILSVIIITVLLILIVIIIKTVLIIGGIHFGDYSGSREKGGERTMDNAFAYFAPSAPTTLHTVSLYTTLHCTMSSHNHTNQLPTTQLFHSYTMQLPQSATSVPFLKQLYNIFYSIFYSFSFVNASVINFTSV